MRTAQASGQGLGASPPPESVLHATGVIDDDFHVPLDMGAVVKAATTPHQTYKLEFNSQGKPFIWQGKATSPGHAKAKARHELFFAEPLFSRYKSKLVSCVEVAS